MSFYHDNFDHDHPEFASVPSKINKCIVLDIDETCVCTFDEMDTLRDLNILKDPKLIAIRSRIYILSMIDVLTKKGSGDRSVVWGVFRPHLKEFIEFCLKYFEMVCVWSAGQYEYIIPLCDNMFSDTEKPHLIWTNKDCVEYGSILIKPLDKLYKHPLLKDKFGPHNTIIVDDRESVFIQNPNNGILIPEYRPEETIESMSKDDTAFSQLVSWLQKDEVKYSDDIRNVDKSNIFM